MVLKEMVVITRKRHLCTSCWKRFDKGTKMLAFAVVLDFDFYHGWMCKMCAIQNNFTWENDMEDRSKLECGITCGHCALIDNCLMANLTHGKSSITCFYSTPKFIPERTQERAGRIRRCPQCGLFYPIEHVQRVYGIPFLTKGCCSPYCYTKVMTGDHDAKDS